MNKMDLYSYSEIKEHPVILKLWRLLNLLIFYWCGNSLRQLLLRIFGAKIGSGCLICRGVLIYAPWNLEIGEMVCIGPHCEIYNKAKIIIGSGVVVSQDAYLCTASHDVASRRMALVTKAIKVQDNVWIAARASILPGVTVGEGAVVGACAVVARDVPPWSVVVGNPAIVVKIRVLTDD